jgi:glycosyltransferase involved in cell wall biosynthesis
LRIWHQFDLAQFVGCEGRIGFPIFELDTFTPREIHHINNLDYMIVCSHWAQRIVKNHSKINPYLSVDVCPLGVDRTIFNENINNPHDYYVTFLNIGKWEVRKGHDVIIQAFEKAFEPSDSVRLWMMCDNPFLSEKTIKAWQFQYKHGRLGSKVSFLSRVKTAHEVARIMGEADCGVFPARAEGWNLELLEMMSLGKQVIATNYSGHTEFCTDNNCMLLDVNELESAYDGIWFHNQGNWAKLTDKHVDQIAEYMRMVYNKKKRSEGLTNFNGIVTAQKFSWENSVKRFYDNFLD